MPQTPLPNTGTILPSDHGDGDQWDILLDNAFRNYDGHNHAAGAGAQVLISSLKIDADISFVDPLGGKHAISDLKAIDFAPVPASALTSFAGAFFLNSADNELYYRTFTGVNVKFTNGALLNVAAFVGGIAGDYTAVGAEEKYDDATNAYWFTQQIGAAVRQYAKMQCADLKLLEFKAHGVAGVPNFGVTLKSPTGLAAGYALTMPAALPAGAVAAPLYVDSTGAITAGSSRTMQFPVSFTSTFWQFGATPLNITTPVPLIGTGDRILAVRARIRDNVTGPTKLTVALQSVVDGVPSTVATSAQSAGSGALQTISASGLTTVAASGTNYQVVIATAAGAATSTAFWIEIDIDHP